MACPTSIEALQLLRAKIAQRGPRHRERHLRWAGNELYISRRFNFCRCEGEARGTASFEAKAFFWLLRSGDSNSGALKRLQSGATRDRS